MADPRYGNGPGVGGGGGGGVLSVVRINLNGAPAQFMLRQYLKKKHLSLMQE